MATITVFFYLLPSFAYSYKIVFSYTLLSHIYINELLISGLHTHHTGREHHELDILLFHEVLDHISRVERVLTAPGGSLLLSGRSGVGRRTTVSLVAHMHQIEIFTPHVSRNYTVKHFKADLKTVSALAQCVCVCCVLRLHMCTLKCTTWMYMYMCVHYVCVYYVCVYYVCIWDSCGSWEKVPMEVLCIYIMYTVYIHVVYIHVSVYKGKQCCGWFMHSCTQWESS